MTDSKETKMGDGLRTIRVITTDATLLSQASAAAASLEGWEVEGLDSIEALLDRAPVAGDVILIDKYLRGENVYELCRALTGKTRCRTWVICQHDNSLSEGIARFCGATGVLHSPLTTSKLRTALDCVGGQLSEIPSDSRGDEIEALLPESLLVSIADGTPDKSLVSALTDPDTSLFNFAFLNYKLDEEFKRAVRWSESLACVMLGFEGQCSPEVLRQLAGIILEASRDTDVLGRFDESSFLFLLPRTGPDGAEVMALRVGQAAQDISLCDLVGDPLVISVGISSCPHPDVKRREDLYSRAREAFQTATSDGGGVACR
ncbi:MAG: diguanylate cyclase [bacterium]